MSHTRRRLKPLSLKDSLVLELLSTHAPGKLDLEKLAVQLYRALRRPQPQYWRMTLSTTLRRLREAGAPLKQIAGGRGRGNRREWRLTARKAGTLSWNRGSSPADLMTSRPRSGQFEPF